MIPCQRHLFDIPDEVAYLNTAYMGAVPVQTMEAGFAGARRKCRPWQITPPDFFSESEQARARFGDLIGAGADDIAIVAAASYGLALAAANLPLARGQKIVVLHEQFPSNVYPWRALAAEAGAQIVTLPRSGDDDWTAAILEAVDDEVGIVALPHCHWTDGAVIDLVAVGEGCRTVGAALVIDGTQSVGALPIDVKAVQPDFLVAACYKWLLGPYGLGFCYVAPKYHATGRPLEHNWQQRENSQDFTGLVDYRDGFQPGARRFDVGERGNFHLIPIAAASFQQLLDWGVAEIQDSLRARTDSIAARAAELGIAAVPRERRAGHYLGLRFEGPVPDGLADRLAAAQVHVSVRGRDSMRITPHLWVNDADEDRLIAVLASAA